MFVSFPGIHWHVPYERPNVSAISEMVLRLSSLMILQSASMISSVRFVEGRPECPQSSTLCSPFLNSENHSEICVLLSHCHCKLL